MCQHCGACFRWIKSYKAHLRAHVSKIALCVQQVCSIYEQRLNSYVPACYQHPRSLRIRLSQARRIDFVEAAPLVMTLGLRAKALGVLNKSLTHRGSPDLKALRATQARS